MSSLTFNDQLIKTIDLLDYFALGLTKNQEDAHDLVQETIAKALTYKNNYTNNSNLKAWLQTIMRNTFINQYRKSKRARKVISKNQEVEVLDFVSAPKDQTPDSSFHTKEINNAIQSLNVSLSVPFLMHFNGFKYQEIADHLNVPLGTVKSRIHLAKQSLQSSLKDFRN